MTQSTCTQSTPYDVLLAVLRAKSDTELATLDPQAPEALPVVTVAVLKARRPAIAQEETAAPEGGGAPATDA